MKSRYASKVMFYGYSYRESETVFSLALVFSVSSTTRKARNIDKYRQKWYNISARKIAETRKKACTRGGVNV